MKIKTNEKSQTSETLVHTVETSAGSLCSSEDRDGKQTGITKLWLFVKLVASFYGRAVSVFGLICLYFLTLVFFVLMDSICCQLKLTNTTDPVSSASPQDRKHMFRNHTRSRRWITKVQMNPDFHPVSMSHV